MTSPPSTLIYQQAAGLIEKAVELIDQYGWIRGAYGDTTSGFCMAGGLSYARDLSKQQQQLYYASYEIALIQLHNTCEQRVTMFNDTAESWDDCREKMKAAEASLRQRGERERKKEEGNATV